MSVRLTVECWHIYAPDKPWNRLGTLIARGDTEEGALRALREEIAVLNRRKQGEKIHVLKFGDEFIDVATGKRLSLSGKLRPPIGKPQEQATFAFGQEAPLF